MRLSGLGSVALVGLVLIVGPTGGGRLRSLPLAAPAPATSPPIALVPAEGGWEFARLDERTMRAGSLRSAPLAGFPGALAFEGPDANTLAVAVEPGSDGVTPDVLRFVDISTLDLLPNSVWMPGRVRTLLW